MVFASFNYSAKCKGKSFNGSGNAILDIDFLPDSREHIAEYSKQIEALWCLRWGYETVNACLMFFSVLPTPALAMTGKEGAGE